MEQISYQLLNESILIIYNGYPYTISNTDPRYNVIKSNLNNLKPEHFTKFNELPYGYKHQNQKLMYHKFEIPSSVENFIFKKENKLSYLNFYANILNRFSEETVFHITSALLSEKLKPISDDGFIVSTDLKIKDDTFIICNYQTDSLENHLYFKKDFYKKTVFLNLIKSLIRDGAKLNYLLKLSLLLKEESLDNTINILSLKPLFNHQESIHDFSIDLFNNFSKDMNNKIKKDRFLNLLNNSSILEIISRYSFCMEEKISLELGDVSPEKALEIINREFNRLSGDNLKLHIIANFPDVIKLQNLSFENFKIEVPTTSKDLVIYGSKLNNCVGNGSYAEKCRKKQSYILGLYQNNSLLASIELDNQNKIIQFEKYQFGKKSHVDTKDSLFIKVQESINKQVR